MAVAGAAISYHVALDTMMGRRSRLRPEDVVIDGFLLLDTGEYELVTAHVPLDVFWKMKALDIVGHVRSTNRARAAHPRSRPQVGSVWLVDADLEAPLAMQRGRAADAPVAKTRVTNGGFANALKNTVAALDDAARTMGWRSVIHELMRHAAGEPRPISRSPQGRDVGQIIAEVSKGARRNPLAFAVGAALAGYALSLSARTPAADKRGACGCQIKTPPGSGRGVTLASEPPPHAAARPADRVLRMQVRVLHALERVAIERGGPRFIEALHVRDMLPAFQPG